MPAPEELLAQAVAGYQALLLAYEKIGRRLDDPQAQALQELAGRIAALHDQVRGIDTLLEGEALRYPALRDTPLEKERRRLAECILRQNELLFPRIHGMMALMNADLQQIRKGMAGVNGYHCPQSNKGERLNASC